MANGNPLLPPAGLLTPPSVRGMQMIQSGITRGAEALRKQKEIEANRDFQNARLLLEKQKFKAEQARAKQQADINTLNTKLGVASKLVELGVGPQRQQDYFNTEIKPLFDGKLDNVNFVGREKAFWKGVGSINKMFQAGEKLPLISEATDLFAAEFSGYVGPEKQRLIESLPGRIESQRERQEAAKRGEAFGDKDIEAYIAAGGDPKDFPVDKKGVQLTVGPDGTIEFSQGGALQQPTKPFQTQIQKETFSAATGLQELTALKQKVTPELFGIAASLKKGLQEVSEFFAPGSTPKFAAIPTANRDRLFRQSEESFALWVKKLTGVQFGEKEATRLKKGYPHSKDNYAEFTTKLDDIINSYVRSIARLRRFNNPTDPRVRNQVFNAVPLSAITQDEINSVKTEFGFGDSTQTQDLSNVSTEELLRQLGQ
jgi:hypothetical protein